MPRGINFALPVALRRGNVMVFIPSLVNLGEFLITGSGHFVLVGIRFARKIRAALHEIEAEFVEAIADLRLAPRSGPVTCELWLYSRYGTLRHFRVNDDALVEVDLYGTALNSKKIVPAAGPSGEEPSPVSGSPATPAVPAAAPIDKRGPILRYLAKWNAARLAGKGAGSPGGSELRTILNAGGTAAKKKRAPGKKPASPGHEVTGSTGIPGTDGGILR
jgi:hypothetical protein